MFCFMLSNSSKFFSEHVSSYFSISKDHFRFLNFKLKSCQGGNKSETGKKVKVEIMPL